MSKTIVKKSHIKTKVITRAFQLMSTAKALTEIYEANFKQVSKYVHATSRGHEAIQIAVGMQLKPQDFIAPYYRDDSLLLSIGMQPYDLMLQLMAKLDDPFSGGRLYYSHPSLKDDDKPKIPYQSSATGMQAIPATGVAMGLQYRELMGMDVWNEGDAPVAVCSLGDASVTEGEVAEAFQMAVLKKLPILYLVQDNGWDISATASETRAMNAFEYAKGFKGLEAVSIDGSDFKASYLAVKKILNTIRNERRPFLLHAKVPLLNHHTSGVRKEWYRDDLEEAMKNDPYPKLQQLLKEQGVTKKEIQAIQEEVNIAVADHFQRAALAPDPKPEDLYTHMYAPGAILTETGERAPAQSEEKVMVDCALIAIKQLMKSHKECLLYGQDVGGRLGGVFREAATLAQKFGDTRVFNTPIQEAFIVGSTAGMSAVGLKPIVEVQFADYIWPGLNQLFTEVSRSCYLSNGKWPVSMVLRVPIGAYGSGGPFHSSSVESVVHHIKGVKIAYPSNGADLFGLLKSAYYDPNPVVIFEHKGLYWSKVKGTNYAKTKVPSEDYIVPFGKGMMVKEADEKYIKKGEAVLVVTYGMGVHWAIGTADSFPDKVGILDIRTLNPIDEDLIFSKSKEYGKIICATEESIDGSFAQSLAGKIQQHCFEFLDAPVLTLGSENGPAIPLNQTLEREFVPSSAKLKKKLEILFSY
jgi:2-oxoisovalerate dehydrogenase E1 component